MRSNSNGMTLVEVMVAVLLLSFVTLGIVSLLSLTTQQNRLARTRSLATNLAVERIDRVSSMPYRSAADVAAYALAGETLVAGPPVRLEADFGSIPDFPEFRRVLTLEYDTPVAGMMSARVEVSWQDLKQGLKTHEMTTMLHPRLEEGL